MIIDKNLLLSLYVDENKGPKEICSILHCHEHDIRNSLIKHKIPSKHKYVRHRPIPGDSFNRWMFVSEATRKNNKRRWLCECKCGKRRTLDAMSVVKGESKSCGCLHAERMKAMNWNGYEEISGSYWSSLQHAAIHRGHDFAISIEYAWQIFLKQDRRCALTGIPIVFAKGRKIEEILPLASLDRKDSSIGYIEGNVQWVYQPINYMKRNLDEHHFIHLCDLVVTHQKTSRR